MSRQKTICVVTGSRAEYGLLAPLLSAIRSERRLRLKLLVTGMHLVPEFGLTISDIEADGWRVDERVEMMLGSDTAVGTVKSLGLGCIGCADAFVRLQPDCVVVLGDRFEIFASAIAASLMRIPLAHIAGGELTEGALDDAMRHTITKLSDLHFPSHEQYRARVIQLGEEPRRVFAVGSLSLDAIRRARLLSRKELERQLGMRFLSRNLLVTFHPETRAANTLKQLHELLASLAALQNTAVLFTASNADPMGRAMNQLIRKFVAARPGKTLVVASLGTTLYYSAMRAVDAVVGNSSSGIVEAPSFRVPTVNIGARQQGRIRASSVIDCPADRRAIAKAIARVQTPGFQKTLRKVRNPYGDGRTAQRIVHILCERLGRLPKVKRFYDGV